MISRLLQVRHIVREGLDQVTNNTMDPNGPALKTRLLILIALEDVKRNALLAETLRKAETPESGTDDEHVHIFSFGNFAGTTICVCA